MRLIARVLFTPVALLSLAVATALSRGGGGLHAPTTGSGFRTPMMRGGSLGRVTVGGIHLTP